MLFFRVVFSGIFSDMDSSKTGARLAKSEKLHTCSSIWFFFSVTCFYWCTHSGMLWPFFDVYLMDGNCDFMSFQSLYDTAEDELWVVIASGKSITATSSCSLRLLVRSIYSIYKKGHGKSYAMEMEKKVFFMFCFVSFFVALAEFSGNLSMILVCSTRAEYLTSRSTIFPKFVNNWLQSPWNCMVISYDCKLSYFEVRTKKLLLYTANDITEANDGETKAYPPAICIPLAWLVRR